MARGGGPGNPRSGSTSPARARILAAEEATMPQPVVTAAAWRAADLDASGRWLRRPDAAASGLGSCA